MTKETKEQSRIRKAKWVASLTPERRAELVARNVAARSARRAAKALSEGRIPGRCGPKALPPEEKKMRYKAKIDKYRAANMDEIRIRDAELHKKQRAEKAIAKGRKPGLIGRERVLTDEQVEANKKAAGRAYWAKMTPEEKWEKTQAEYKRNKASKQKYYQDNKEQKRVIGRNYRARKTGNGGTHTKEDIKALFFEQKGLCGLCDMKLDAENFHVDHWKPMAKGGANDKSNLKLLHPTCNLRKSSKDPSELKIGTFNVRSN